ALQGLPAPSTSLDAEVAPERVAGGGFAVFDALVQAQHGFAAGVFAEVILERLPRAIVLRARDHAFFNQLVVGVNDEPPGAAGLRADVHLELRLVTEPHRAREVATADHGV